MGERALWVGLQADGVAKPVGRPSGRLGWLRVSKGVGLKPDPQRRALLQAGLQAEGVVRPGGAAVQAASSLYARRMALIRV